MNYMSYIWQSSKQEPTDTLQNKPVGQPAIIHETQPSVPFIKKVLPLVITGSIIVNLAHALFALFGNEYAVIGDTLRNYGNFFLATLLLIAGLRYLITQK